MAIVPMGPLLAAAAAAAARMRARRGAVSPATREQQCDPPHVNSVRTPPICPCYLLSSEPQAPPRAERGREIADLLAADFQYSI